VARIFTTAPFPRLDNQHKWQISVKDTRCERSEETVCMRAAEIKPVSGPVSQHRWQQVSTWLRTCNTRWTRGCVHPPNTKRQQWFRNRTRARRNGSGVIGFPITCNHLSPHQLLDKIQTEMLFRKLGCTGRKIISKSPRVTKIRSEKVYV
jgi:hypothetical protein